MKFSMVVVLLALPVFGIAQQKTEKGQPESRPADVQQPSRQETPLPTIDLPEFIITGSASIDPPDAQKFSYEEDGTYRRLPSENTPGPRERETLDLGERFKQSLLLASKNVSGNLSASLGNYFTPELGASVGLTDPSYDLAASASYSRTKGFTQGADASFGMISVHGSHEILTGSSSIQQARLTGAVGLDTRSYKFYGSIVQPTQRDLTRFNVLVQGAANLEPDVPMSVAARFQGLSVRDTATTTTESSVKVNVSGSVPVMNFPLDVAGRAWFSTVTAISSHRLSLISLGVGTQRLTWGVAAVRAGVEGYRIEGMDGQEGSYFFPYVFLDVRFLQQHTAFLSAAPGPEFQTLDDQIGRNPYLSARASIRHTIARLALTVGIESNWNSWLSTKGWIDFRSMSDYPFYADSSGAGVWLLAYGGKTTVTAFHVEGVANISTNDYFAVKNTVRLSRSTITQHIPYAPNFESLALWTHRFESDVEATSTVGYVSQQDADFVGTSHLRGHFWTGLRIEYLGFGDLRIFTEATNVADQKYERWKGYRSDPFRLSAGLMYRW